MFALLSKTISRVWTLSNPLSPFSDVSNSPSSDWDISQFLILELKSFQNLYLFLNISFPVNAFQTIFKTSSLF